MKLGDIAFMRKVRLYANNKIIQPGTSEWEEVRPAPGMLSVYVYLGDLPKGSTPQVEERLAVAGWAPKEGYPNPNRFNSLDFQDACLEHVGQILKRLPRCCDDAEPVIEHHDVPMMACPSCDFEVSLEPCGESANSIMFTHSAIQTWIKTVREKIPNEANRSD